MQAMRLFLIFVQLLGFAGSASAEYVCSRWREPLYYFLMSSKAGKPQKSDFPTADNIQVTQISTTMKDDSVLSGYTIQSNVIPVRGRILVLQGNGHRASVLLHELASLARDGYELYIYDYRGYATSSSAEPSFKANMDDYKLIIDYLLKDPGSPLSIYAMSYGGIVVLNSLDGTEAISLLILDSVPDSISGLGCPEKYYPQHRIAQMRMPTVLIVSGKDREFERNEQEQLIYQISQNSNSSVIEKPTFHHPFTPGIDQTERIGVLLDLLRKK